MNTTVSMLRSICSASCDVGVDIRVYSSVAGRPDLAGMEVNRGMAITLGEKDTIQPVFKISQMSEVNAKSLLIQIFLKTPPR